MVFLLTSFQPLAQDELGSGSAIFWSICLLVLVVILFGASVLLRKHFATEKDFHGDGFTLSDLRKMHRAGKMSDEEFERTKQVLLAGLSRKSVPPADPLSGGPNLRSIEGSDQK